jgi:murein DD-endopeptidase MepM/ murein hydrolase activator NlpD
MRWSMLFLAVSAWGQTFNVTPLVAHQGETLKVTGDKEMRSARMHGRTITLFPRGDGQTFGLMPVPVLERPSAYKLEFLDEKGVVLQTENVTVTNAHYPQQNIVIAPSIAGLKPSPGEQQTVNDFRKTVSNERYWQEPLTPPEPGCLTSPFGVMRLHNGKPTGDYHAGVDQRGAAGTPIHPIAAGVVKIVKPYNLRGGTVAVDHGQGLESIYLHMSSFAAKEGEHVTPDSVIGYVGTTGRSTGPHVHWTIYVYGEAVDPNQWMSLKNCPAPAPAHPRKGE